MSAMYVTKNKFTSRMIIGVLLFISSSSCGF